VDTAASRTVAFHTVGLGASAGGLEALEAFFDATPADTGLAFAVVTHQPSGHVSLLPELLARHAKMPVELVVDGMQVQPNHVYVSPPGKNLSILGGNLQTMDPAHGGQVHLPIDYFFRSLATDQEDGAICIVLSGTGTDGTLGLRDIKGHAGMAIVQSEGSARYSGMPSSAVATGLADYVLSPEQMPAQLIAYTRAARAAHPSPMNEVELSDALRKIFVLLRNHTGHDFSGYKVNTMRRRVERRMRVHSIEQPLEYVRFLQANPHEIDLLFQELLIGVTSFFRDKEVFDALETALRKLVAAKPDDAALRVWVPGCSTGEEAYSIGILAAEIAARSKKRLDVQIFATDLDTESIEFARAGLYAEGVAADLAPGRLERFFTREGNRCRINKEIRGMVVFAIQNVIKDPPFTKLDLVSCRNLLIYLNADLQKRLVPVFHYALNPGGILLLGTSETTSNFEQLFEPIDRKWRIYERKPAGPNAVPPSFPMSTPPRGRAAVPAPASVARGVAEPVERVLLERFVPATVIANERGDIAYVYGRAGAYLEPNAGEPRPNLFAMAREGLEYELRSALRLAARDDREIERPGVQILTDDGGKRTVNVIVKRIADPEAVRGLFRVSFEATKDRAPAEKPRRRSGRRVRDPEMERELKDTRDTLKGTVEELETSNEDLKSSNEELQSMNEELQSANEELETSKEELQSLNEELQTVNAEFQTKLEELSRSNDDMRNLLNSTEIATLFLDRHLRIMRFTDQISEVISVTSTDVGRPVDDFASRVRYDKLTEDARRVLDTLAPHEVEVQTNEGRWRLLRMFPYRTSQNVIDGVVITFVDIDRVKRAELLAASRAFAQSIVHTVREPLVVLDEDFRIVSANPAFFRIFQLSEDDVSGRSLFDVGGAFFPVPRLRERLGDVIAKGSTFQDMEIEHEFPDLGRRRILLNARRLESETGTTGHILLALEDATGRPLR
jgi:two-component system, chemotaxis family, CheB/CheR fusion protein